MNSPLDATAETADASRWLARARTGDAAAFCDLVQLHESRLLNQAAALCHNPHLAQDLVQETLLEAWKSLHRFDDSCRLSTWLYAILLHRHQKAIRHARSRPRLADSRDLQVIPTLTGGTSPADDLIQRQITGRLNTCIESLPEKFRMVIRLRFFAGASLEEIAAALDCSLGTVKSRLHNGLEKLRRMSLGVNLSDLPRDRRGEQSP